MVGWSKTKPRRLMGGGYEHLRLYEVTNGGESVYEITNVGKE
jgi:hypothetical protein